MKVNKKIIKKLNPCKERFDNYLKHYKNFSGDILEFLALGKITPKDKIWVTLRLFWGENDLATLQVFAIDCVFAAYAYADSADAADAADAAADSAAYAAAYSAYAYAYAYAAADYAAAAAASAAYAAADSAAAYAYAAAYAAERERQVDCLAYLIMSRGKK